jgi:hypothetical protein
MKFASTLLLALAGLAGSGSAVAGPFNDALSVCLVKSTTEHDRTLFVRWVFAAIAQHPQVSDMSSISPAESEKLSKEVADLFFELVSKRCHDETADAFKYEGAAAVSSSFGALGKAAMQGLMADPAVDAYFEKMGSYIDEEKLKALFSTKAPASVEPAKPDAQ